MTNPASLLRAYAEPFYWGKRVSKEDVVKVINQDDISTISTDLLLKTMDRLSIEAPGETDAIKKIAEACKLRWDHNSEAPKVIMLFLKTHPTSPEIFKRFAGIESAKVGYLTTRPHLLQKEWVTDLFTDEDLKKLSAYDLFRLIHLIVKAENAEHQLNALSKIVGNIDLLIDRAIDESIDSIPTPGWFNLFSVSVKDYLSPFEQKRLSPKQLGDVVEKLAPWRGGFEAAAQLIRNSQIAHNPTKVAAFAKHIEPHLESPSREFMKKATLELFEYCKDTIDQTELHYEIQETLLQETLKNGRKDPNVNAILRARRNICDYECPIDAKIALLVDEPHLLDHSLTLFLTAEEMRNLNFYQLQALVETLMKSANAQEQLDELFLVAKPTQRDAHELKALEKSLSKLPEIELSPYEIAMLSPKQLAVAAMRVEPRAIIPVIAEKLKRLKSKAAFLERFAREVEKKNPDINLQKVVAGSIYAHRESIRPQKVPPSIKNALVEVAIFFDKSDKDFVKTNQFLDTAQKNDALSFVEAYIQKKRPDLSSYEVKVIAKKIDFTAKPSLVLTAIKNELTEKQVLEAIDLALNDEQEVLKIYDKQLLDVQKKITQKCAHTPHLILPLFYRQKSLSLAQFLNEYRPGENAFDLLPTLLGKDRYIQFLEDAPLSDTPKSQLENHLSALLSHYRTLEEAGKARMLRKVEGYTQNNNYYANLWKAEAKL